ncbi:MAG: hypothetical protein AAGI38_07170 [Bacteroidota bacterium]
MNWPQFAFRLPVMALAISGCSTFTTVPEESPQMKVSTEEQFRVDACLALVEQEKGLRTYHLLEENGNVALVQKHKVRVDSLDGGKGFVFRELYNVFHSDEDNTTEYYLSEFTLKPGALEIPSLVDDYRVVIKPDSGFTYPNEKSVFSLSKIHQVTLEQSGTYEVYELKGYEHTHGQNFEDTIVINPDLPPAYTKFWHPNYGTLMVRYQGGLSFELVEMDETAYMQVLPELMEEVKGM